VDKYFLKRRMIKSEKRQKRTKRNVKKDRVIRTELQLHKD